VQQKYKRWMCGVVVLVGSGVSLGAMAPKVEVSIYNDTQLSRETLTQAEDEAKRIFQKAGMTLVFVDARGLGRDGSHKTVENAVRLSVRIIPHSKNLSETTFGVSFLGEDGEGAFADVFLDRAQALSAGWNVSLVHVLGHVVAHELGHLLLGSNGHASQGIMRPRWQHAELVKAATGTLVFTPEQARRMVARVSAGKRESEVLQVAALRK